MSVGSFEHPPLRSSLKTMKDKIDKRENGGVETNY